MAEFLNDKPIYWECTVDGHNKFWAAQIFRKDNPVMGAMGHNTTNKIEYVLERKWGMIGTEGQKMEQAYDELYQAERVLDELIRGKENKGYKPIF